MVRVVDFQLNCAKVGRLRDGRHGYGRVAHARGAGKGGCRGGKYRYHESSHILFYTGGVERILGSNNGGEMRTEQRIHPWESSTTRSGLVIAVAIHVALIAALIGRSHVGNFTAGDDSFDGSGDAAPLAGAAVIPKWNTHQLVIMDERYARLPLARVHLLLGDSMKVTSADGATMFTIRTGTMFVVRVTRPGYEPQLLRLPNHRSEASPHEIRMFAVKPQ